MDARVKRGHDTEVNGCAATLALHCAGARTIL
jgi:hypothetical protein